MLEFEIGPIHIEGPVTQEWEALLRVSVPFCLRVDGFAVLDEPSFPIIEFVRALQSWDCASGTFEYNSQESDMPPLVFFKGERGFYVASPLSRTCADVVIDRAIVISTFKAIADAVRESLRPYGLDHYVAAGEGSAFDDMHIVPSRHDP